MEIVDRSRRAFLWALGALLASGGLLASRLKGRRAPARSLLVVEKRSIPARGALVYRESRVAVVRDGGRYHALSLVCTHLGCTVEVTPKTVICPCHGSVFDRSGRVVRGPADRPLERYEVEDRGDCLAVLARA